MKITTALYAALAVVGASAIVLVPLAMYRSGSPALPAWRAAVSPGPLSAAHAFLGVNAKAATFQTKASAGRSAAPARGPSCWRSSSKPEPAALRRLPCRAQRRRSPDPHGPRSPLGRHVAPPAGAGRPQLLAALEDLLGEAGAALRPSGAALSAKQAEALDCAACHAVQDPHRGRFGTASCQSCHTTENWAVAGWQHPSPRSTDCATVPSAAAQP